jgi:hypothetical protein
MLRKNAIALRREWKTHLLVCAIGESQRPVVESPWSLFTSECQRF